MSFNEEPIQPSEGDCNLSMVYANSNTSIELKMIGLEDENGNGKLPHQQNSFTAARKERKNALFHIFQGKSFSILRFGCNR